MKFAPFQNALSPIAAMVLGTCALTTLSSEANALPKNGTGRCTCACNATLSDGTGVLDMRAYESQGLACTAFQGATCNIEDPNSGIIAQGRLLWCGDEVRGGVTISVLTGTVLVSKNVKVLRMTPRRRPVQ